jgi:hypothetical protein
VPVYRTSGSGSRIFRFLSFLFIYVSVPYKTSFINRSLPFKLISTLIIVHANGADRGCLSRILIFSIPDSGAASKNLSILTQKNGFEAFGNMIQVVHPRSGSRILIFTHRIPYPGVKKAPDPGSGSATLVHVGLGTLDEPYSAKPAQRSCPTSLQVYLCWNRCQPMYPAGW